MQWLYNYCNTINMLLSYYADQTGTGRGKGGRGRGRGRGRGHGRGI